MLLGVARIAAVALTGLVGIAVGAPVTALASTGVPKVDINGDGWADIVVVSRDSLHVRYSDGNGGSDGTWVDYTKPSDPASTSTAGYWETAVTACDFNADGRSDVAVGLPYYYWTGGYDEDRGAVAVYFGGTRLAPPVIVRQGTGGVPGADEAGDGFGFSVACGKIGSDAYADLLIGAPNEDVGSLNRAGAVTVVRGAASGLATAGNYGISQDTAGVPGTAESGDTFGTSVAVADVTGDGLSEIIATSPGENEVGLVHSLKGTSAGWTATGSTSVLGSPASGWLMGTSMAVGRFDGSGALDVALGSSGSGTAGAVTILRGGSGNLTSSARTVLTQDSPGVPGASESQDMWGFTLAAGPLGSDPYDDLVIGAMGEDTTANRDGAITVMRGSATGLTTTGILSVGQDSAGVPGAAEDYDSLGSAVSVADYTGDGVRDVVSSAGGEKVGTAAGAGALVVLPGATSGATTTGAVGYSRPVDGFGAGLLGSSGFAYAGG